MSRDLAVYDGDTDVVEYEDRRGTVDVLTSDDVRSAVKDQLSRRGANERIEMHGVRQRARRAVRGIPEDAPRNLSNAVAKEWNDISPRVQGDLLKMSAVWSQIQPWVNLTEQNGTTLPVALAQYNKLENLFMTDPVIGMAVCNHRLGVSTAGVNDAFCLEHSFCGLETDI